eukprot:GHVU01215709.1.p2 GENE.GHVU01215709.1~~GHVU01215709.1.p2  ORF type:complete len:127 (+),score=13.05 GHVU01215709.1:1279-1659(+)
MYMSYAGKNAAGPATRVENDNGSAGDSSYRSGTRRRIRRIGKEHANAAESLESSFDISRRLWATFRLASARGDQVAVKGRGICIKPMEEVSNIGKHQGISSRTNSATRGGSFGNGYVLGPTSCLFF